jgi:hypothetical protein
MANVGYYSNEALVGCNPDPNCVGSRCCPGVMVPPSGYGIPGIPSRTPAQPAQPGGMPDLPSTDQYVPTRDPVPGVETGWTTRCANGMCPDTTSTATMGGHNVSYIGPDKTVNHNVVPYDTFAARDMWEVASRARGGPHRDLGTINRDWDTQGIHSLRGSPEFSAYVESLRPTFGDSAEAVATRNMAGAEGMQGGYSNSSYFAPDNAARHDAASRMQATALAGKDSTAMAVALGIDPSAFNNQGVLFDDQGKPYSAVQTPEGDFGAVQPANPGAGIDYTDVAAANFGGMNAFTKQVEASRAMLGKLSLEQTKQTGRVTSATIRADASTANNAASNAVKLEGIRARIAQLSQPRVSANGTRGLSFEQQKELIKLRSGEKRLQQWEYLNNSGKLVAPKTETPRL